MVIIMLTHMLMRIRTLIRIIAPDIVTFIPTPRIHPCTVIVVAHTTDRR